MSENGFDIGGLPPDALSEAISQLTQHPEIISAVASAFGTLQSNGGETPQDVPASAPADEGLPTDLISTLAPLLSGGAIGGYKKSPKEEHRDALLCALKPYMCDRRREMIDYILKFGRFGDILKKLR